MMSDEGLNAYGAVTWGQFFVYQGFNERAGWMHTSSGVDDVDEYLETVVKKGDGFYYKYGTEERPVTARKITVPYKTATGMAQKEFTVYRTHHGPIVREADGKWVSVRLMQEPVKALTQSYTRTKAKDYKAFRQTMELHTNSSNNTIFADADGDIAYFHANFIPKRDTEVRLDQAGGRQRSGHRVEGPPLRRRDARNLLNPASGWLYNTNNWPWSAAGPNSPKKADYPAYMERGVENPRGACTPYVSFRQEGLHAGLASGRGLRQLPHRVRRSDPHAAQGVRPDPGQQSAQGEGRRADRAPPGWDYRWSASSVPTSLAVFWGEEMWRRVRQDAQAEEMSVYEYVAKKTPASQKLQALAPRPTSSPPISAPGRRHGATSTASSASPTTSCIRSATRGQAFRSASPRRGGARWRRSARVPTRARRRFTAPAGTASWRSSNSATASGRGRRHRRRGERQPSIAALQRSGGALQHGRPAGCVLLFARSSRGTPSGSTIRVGSGEGHSGTSLLDASRRLPRAQQSGEQPPRDGAHRGAVSLRVREYAQRGRSRTRSTSGMRYRAPITCSSRRASRTSTRTRPTTVNFANDTRAPLLLIAGARITSRRRR